MLQNTRQASQRRQEQEIILRGLQIRLRLIFDEFKKARRKAGFFYSGTHPLASPSLFHSEGEERPDNNIPVLKKLELIVYHENTCIDIPLYTE